MSETIDYDKDFVGWTERQARILKTLPAGAFGLDIENLAEEIETLGRNEIREASSFIRQTLIHLVKMAAEPHSDAARKWAAEVTTFQFNAILACTAGLKQRVELAKIWKLAAREAVRDLREYGVTLSNLPSECPLTLDELLDEDFDPYVAAATVANRIAGTA